MDGFGDNNHGIMILAISCLLPLDGGALGGHLIPYESLLASSPQWEMLSAESTFFGLPVRCC